MTPARELPDNWQWADVHEAHFSGDSHDSWYGERKWNSLEGPGILGRLQRFGVGSGVQPRGGQWTSDR